ncbi:LrgB family protein [Peribacillus tepidiphilus]|uniref:LrgB family protein n=1 Tax=Peribacillus tepidiphilus TaxID=2652445 RepID=UPI0035B565E8
MSIFVTIYSVFITLSVYLISRVVGRKYPSPFTTPVFFSTTIIILILLVSDVSFKEYTPAKEFMTYLLGPATVALAIPLYKNRTTIIRYLIPAFSGMIVGIFASLFSILLLSSIFSLQEVIVKSLAVSTVTVPIAIEITKLIGGDPTLSTAFVVACGTLGSMMGPALLDYFKVHEPIARGLALGTISHGQGTAQASLEGELNGAIAGIAMGITPVLVSFILPAISKFIF